MTAQSIIDFFNESKSPYSSVYIVRESGGKVHTFVNNETFNAFVETHDIERAFSLTKDDDGIIYTRIKNRQKPNDASTAY